MKAGQPTRNITASLRMLLLCLLPFGFSPITVYAANASGDYVIVLASARGKNLDWLPASSSLFENRRLFVTQISLKGKAWERLNLGFFDNRKQVDALLPDVRKLYPDAWVSKDTIAEKKYLTAAVDQPVTKNKKAVVPRANEPQKTDDEKIESQMSRAKSEFTQNRYPQAIRLFTAIAQAKPNRYSQEALELLGLSRQRNGQKTHAFDIYTQYLKKYPQDDAGSIRVMQRLSGLMTESKAPMKSIRMSSEKPATGATFYGSWSQFYRKDMVTADNTDTITANSQLINFLDLTAIKRSAGISHKAQLTADDTYDFLDNGDGNEFRFIEMYYEMSYRESGTSARFGRQSLRLGGLLKRFDGISAGYQFTPDLRFNVLAGFPVEITNKSSINSDKKFYGFTLETGTFLKHWNMNLFHFQQYIFGNDDSSSTGIEARYTDSTKSLYGMIDYDFLYKVINIVQLNANMNLSEGRSLYMNAYSRKTPLLTTSNALIGRQETSIAELEQTLNIEQIRQLALDRTATSQTITVGGTQPINEKFQVTADITLSKTSSTVASGGVDATPGTGTDYFLSTQLVGNNLFRKNDTGILGLRYLDTDPSNTVSLIANTRFPITRNWRVNPRIQYDYLKLVDGRTVSKWRTQVRTDYRYGRSVRFDLELGYDDTSNQSNGGMPGNTDLYFTLGYRWDF